MVQSYSVKGMTCGGCSRSVSEAIRREWPDVAVEISLEAASVAVTGKHDPSKMEEVIEDAGFDFGGQL